MKTLQLNFQKKLFPLIAENRSNLFEKYNLKKPDKIELPNNHLQYALTWYSLCFVIIIAFLIYKRKI
jgi:cytochrome oxidase assembly protein ShyY1